MMNRILPLAALGLLAGFFLTGCPGNTCDANSDCEGNEGGAFCDTGSGECVACVASADCTGGQACVDNACAACTQDAQCGAGLACVDASCVECRANTDCGSGEVCGTDNRCAATCTSDADCLAPAAACNRATGACVACLVDAHCPAGEVCDASAMTCAAGGCQSDVDCMGNPSGGLCSSGQCVRCMSNDDCGESSTCDAVGQCVSATTCTTDADCADSGMAATCDPVAGRCVECLEQADCEENYSSVICVIERSDCVECVQDTDCSGDYPFCDRSTGYCEACVADDQCSDAIAPVCVAGFFNECGCRADDDCQDATAQYCNPDVGSCVVCRTEADCSGDTPFCNADAGECIECLLDTDCPETSPHCTDWGLCGACLSTFDCTDAAAPVCSLDADDRPVCGVVDECTTDDAGEHGDDGPAGATSLDPATGNTTQLTSRQICASESGDEGDWFVFTAADGDHVTLTLEWTGDSDLDVIVIDSELTTIGRGYFQQPETVALTYLPAGTYHAIVTRYQETGDMAEPVEYAMTFERTPGNTCASSADCAGEYASQFFRGSCNATSGACEFIVGNEALVEGAACDSLDDCATGLCGYGGETNDLHYAHMKDAHLRGFCKADVCSASDECTAPEVCSGLLCLPVCTEDAHCQVDWNRFDNMVDGWPRASCNVTTGVCE